MRMSEIGCIASLALKIMMRLHANIGINRMYSYGVELPPLNINSMEKQV